MNACSRRAADRSGQVLVMVVIMLVALIGFAALAIDAGHAYALRRQVQNAADAAALAGARLVASGGTDAAIWADVRTYVGSNSKYVGTNTTAYYTDNNGTHVATVGNGAVPGAATGVEVVTTTVAPTFFGTIWGSFSTFSPTAVGGARAVPLPALFAGECNAAIGPPAIDWSGGGWYVTGNIQDNTDLNMSGSGNTISNSTISALAGFTPSGLANKATLANSTLSSPASCAAYPVTFNIADYAPGGSQAVAAGANYYSIAGDSSLSSYVNGGVLAPGLYYVNGNVNFSSPSVVANVTIVATGQIQISSSGSTWTPYIQDLLYYTSITTAAAPGGKGVNVSGSGSTWAGIIYAPNSTLQMSGSANSSVSGALIGNALDLTGSGLTIRSGFDPNVFLYE